MWPGVSPRHLQAARTAHTVITSAIHLDPITDVETALTIKDDGDSHVVDDSTAEHRRILTLTLPTSQATWDTLSVPGGEITVVKTTRYIDGMTEAIPQGVYVVDQDQIGYGPGDSLALTCPDRWLIVKRNRFGIARSSVPGNAVWQEIKRLVEGAWPNGGFPGWASRDETVTAKVGPIVWTDGDRAKAIKNLADAHSLEMYFDRDGLAVLRTVPILTTNSIPVWTIDADEGGVMIGASRTFDMSTVRNAWVVSSSATDLHLAPQEVKNTNAADPLSTVNKLGYVPGYFSSPALRTTGAMLAAGKTKLRKSLGIAQQITLEAAPNVALDSEDVVRVKLPRISRTLTRPSELHMLDQVTTPLTAAGTQPMQTRSTRPPSDDEGST